MAINVNNKLGVDTPQAATGLAQHARAVALTTCGKPGAVSVQVLRSASSKMTQQEQVGRNKAGVNLPLPPGINVGGVQAMLQAISSAQHFIYIENQFFQSAFGQQGELNPLVPLSGPMASLRDPSSLNQDFVSRVRLREALDKEDIWQLAPDVIHKLNAVVSPLPGLPGYADEPYTLFADGASIQEGLTGPDGVISFEHIPGTQTYAVELVNGHRFDIEAIEESGQPALPSQQLARKGYRDYQAQTQQLEPLDSPDDYRNAAMNPAGKPSSQ